MDFLKTALMAFVSLIYLFLLTKIMGKRQMSQLSMFDYIIGITIGSIAAEMAVSDGKEVLEGGVAMAVYALVAALISWMTSKSIVLRRFVNGKALILFDDGKLYRRNLSRARLDLSEFLTQCRCSGYFDLSELQTVYIEQNGKISFLPAEGSRPATTSDLGMPAREKKQQIDVIEDGQIMRGNLRFSGNDEKWLQNQLRIQGYRSVREIFLGTVSSDNRLSLYPVNMEKAPRDPFQ